MTHEDDPMTHEKETWRERSRRKALERVRHEEKLREAGGMVLGPAPRARASTGLPPPPAPRKKTSIGTIAVLVIGGLFLLGSLINAFDGDDTGSDPPTTYEDPAVSEADFVEIVVDTTLASNPGSLAEFCDAYTMLGYDLAFESFKTGYTDSDPSPTAVFNEVISRC